MFYILDYQSAPPTLLIKWTRYCKEVNISSLFISRSSSLTFSSEIFRLVIFDLHSKGLIFGQQDLSGINEPYCINTEVLSFIEDDESTGRSKTKERMERDFNIKASASEVNFIHTLAEMVAVRGARLCACGIAAICHKTNTTEGHVAADGSVANKHPKFKKRWADALAEILDWPADRDEDPIIMTSAEDGSGVGAAVIVAMAVEHGWT